MTRPVIVRRLAERDIEKSVRWHEQQRLGLGSRFRRRVEETINRVESNPYQFAAGLYGIRHAPTKRFKFVIHYRILSTIVEVIAVLLASRNSSVWINRAKP